MIHVDVFPLDQLSDKTASQGRADCTINPFSSNCIRLPFSCHSSVQISSAYRVHQQTFEDIKTQVLVCANLWVKKLNPHAGFMVDELTVFGFGPGFCLSGLTALSGIAQAMPNRSAPGTRPSLTY